MSTGKPKQKTRERILETAIHAFRTDGYARTTTQSIAEQADVAEVTVFRHFKNKQQLFQAVVQQIGGTVELDTIESQLVDHIQTDLHLISRHILFYFSDQQATIRMLMFESAHFSEMQGALAQNPREMIRFLSGYLRRQIELGQLRNINPDAMAQTFISMLFGYAVGIAPIKALLPSEMSTDEVAETFIDIFLKGIVSDDE